FPTMSPLKSLPTRPSWRDSSDLPRLIRWDDYEELPVKENVAPQKSAVLVRKDHRHFTPCWPDGSDAKQPLYPGFERDVLRTVADYYQRLKEPLLTYHLYEVFVNILSKYFHSDRETIGHVNFFFVRLREQDSSLFILLQACCRSRIKPPRLFKSAACCCHRPTGDGSSFYSASWIASATIPAYLHLMTLSLLARWYFFPHFIHYINLYRFSVLPSSGHILQVSVIP
ncbi:hypothetical protein XENOCAPTIV_029527, partial [Xenoophorus captivus]